MKSYREVEKNSCFLNYFIENMIIKVVDKVPIYELYKAYIIRDLSYNFESVILYHPPYDIIPTIAFADSKCPPVLIENHARSWFWLGYNIADIVFLHSIFHVDFTKTYSNIDKNYYLPLSQFDNRSIKMTFSDKITAKMNLGIPACRFCKPEEIYNTVKFLTVIEHVN